MTSVTLENGGVDSGGAAGSAARDAARRGDADGGGRRRRRREGARTSTPIEATVSVEGVPKGRGSVWSTRGGGLANFL